MELGLAIAGKRIPLNQRKQKQQKQKQEKQQKQDGNGKQHEKGHEGNNSRPMTPRTKAQQVLKETSGKEIQELVVTDRSLALIKESQNLINKHKQLSKAIIDAFKNTHENPELTSEERQKTKKEYQELINNFIQTQKDIKVHYNKFITFMSKYEILSVKNPVTDPRVEAISDYLPENKKDEALLNMINFIKNLFHIE